MPDTEVIQVGIASVAAAWMAKDGVTKLLGPTADFLGQGLKGVVERRFKLMNSIFKNAIEKLGDKVDSPGIVPPKVLKHIIDNGSFAVDELAIEYFGGVLASSRTENGRDDRAASLLGVVEALSVYQLRAHYIFYSVVKRLYAGQNFNFNLANRQLMNVYIPESEFIDSMGFEDSELQKKEVLYSHILSGLVQQGLIDGSFNGFGHKGWASIFVSDPVEGGIIYRPTIAGAELFLSASGVIDELPYHLFDDAFEGRLSDAPPIPQSAKDIGYYDPNSAAVKAWQD